MKKILHIMSSPRGPESLSIKLGNAVVEKLQAKYSGSTLSEVNLVDYKFPHLEEAHLQSFFTPAESRSTEQQEAVKHSDEAIAALKDADIIVLGAPMYNFTVHSSLKAWLDHVVRAGVTFQYGESGPKGLLTGKKVYVAESSGGVYSEGLMKSADFVTPFLKTILGFIGLTDVTFFRIEGIKVPGVMETAVEKGLNSINVD